MADFEDRRTRRKRLPPPTLAMLAATLTAGDLAEHACRQAEHTRSLRPLANWAKWSHFPKAELWQCVALSFGIEPVDTMRRVLGGLVLNAEPRPQPWFAGHEYTDMRERFDIALANAGSDELSSLHPLPPPAAEMAVRLFSTAEFGGWARSLGWEVPAEFPASKAQAPAKSTTTDALLASPAAEASSDVPTPSGAGTPGVDAQQARATPAQPRPGATDTPASEAVQSKPVQPANAERTKQREDRRLTRFEAIGGVLARVAGGAWNVDRKNGKRGALASLVKEERAAGHPRSDRKDISTDLSAAAERRRNPSQG